MQSFILHNLYETKRWDNLKNRWESFCARHFTKLSKDFNVFWFLLLEWNCFAISLPVVIKACSISNIWFMSAFTINFCFYDNIVFCGFGVISKRQQLFNSQRLFINFLLDSLKIGQCWVVFNIINYTVDSTEPKRKNKRKTHLSNFSS